MRGEDRNFREVIDKGRALSLKAITKLQERLDYSEDELVDIGDVSDN